MPKRKMHIGFIGQGYIGKNYANDFERRGYRVTRYAQEKPYNLNKEKIKECDLVFIAVPTPTRNGAYDPQIIYEVLPLVGKNKIIVLKSTIYPGLTREIQKKFPEHVIIHSPEFLSETTAEEDARKPFANIIGIKDKSKKNKNAARLVHAILPQATFSSTVSFEEAEIIKYTHNGMAVTEIIFFNLMYDLAQKLGADWKNIEKFIKADPFIPHRYTSPFHKNGRGAGGRCFIKDFAALCGVYEKIVSDKAGVDALRGLEIKNIELLKNSKKDLELLWGVYPKL